MIEMKEVRVEIGVDTRVIINKLFGPHIFVKLRVTADMTRGWVIERESGPDAVWVEWVVIPDQMDIDFIDWAKVDASGLDRTKQ